MKRTQQPPSASLLLPLSIFSGSASQAIPREQWLFPNAALMLPLLVTGQKVMGINGIWTVYVASTERMSLHASVWTVHILV
jgi:hypothetical protein